MDCQRDTEACSPLQTQLFSLQGHTPEKPCYFLLILPIIFQMIIRHDQIHIGRILCDLIFQHWLWL